MRRMLMFLLLFVILLVNTTYATEIDSRSLNEDISDAPDNYEEEFDRITDEIIEKTGTYAITTVLQHDEYYLYWEVENITEITFPAISINYSIDGIISTCLILDWEPGAIRQVVFRYPVELDTTGSKEMSFFDYILDHDGQYCYYISNPSTEFIKVTSEFDQENLEQLKNNPLSSAEKLLSDFNSYSDSFVEIIDSNINSISEPEGILSVDIYLETKKNTSYPLWATANMDILSITDDEKIQGKLSIVQQYASSILAMLEYIEQTNNQIVANKILDYFKTESQLYNELFYSDSENKHIDNILLDDDKYYIEYRGIYEYSSQSWIINLYIENKSEERIYVVIKDAIVNGFSISIANNGEYVSPGVKYLANPNFDFIIDTNDLRDYGIETLETLSFELEIRTSMFGETLNKEHFDFMINKNLP